MAFFTQVARFSIKCVPVVGTLLKTKVTHTSSACNIFLANPTRLFSSPATPLEEYPQGDLLASGDWLADVLTTKKKKQSKDAPADVRVIDCRAEQLYKASHIPSATWFASNLKSYDNPKHVVTPDEMEDVFEQLAISTDTNVVLYDDTNCLSAARVRWVFSYYGLPNVKVLNGGWVQWLKNNFKIEKTARTYKLADNAKAHKPVAQRNKIATLEDVVNRSEASILLDVRTEREWTGEDVRNSRGGHVPAAEWLQWNRLLANGALLPPSSISSLLAHLAFIPPDLPKDTEIITYCQSGVRAANTALVLEVMGFTNVKVFDGSMGVYAEDESQPPLHMGTSDR